MKHTWIFVIGLFLVASGCQQPPPPPEKPTLLTPPAFDLGWQFATNDTSPIVNMYCQGDYLFAYTDAGRSYVLDRKNGKLEQIDDVPAATGQMKAPAVLKDSIAYATADAVQIYDLHGSLTRTIALQYTLTSGIAGTGTSANPMLFVAEAYPDGGRLAAIDLNMLGGITYESNSQIEKINAYPVRWEYLVQHAQIVSTPVVLKDTVYVAAADGSVAALATDRDAIWSNLDNGVFRCGGGVLADLAVDEYGVYAASYDSKLYCLNPNNGKVRWQYYAQTPLTTGPVATKDLVYQFVPGLGVAAIEKVASTDHNKKPEYDRSPRWVAGDCTKFLAEDAKYAYLLRNDHHLSARDKTTGAEVFASKRSDFIAVAANNSFGAGIGSSPAGSTIFVTLKDNTIAAINAVTLPGIIGELVWDDATGKTGPGAAPAAAPAPNLSLASTKAPRSAEGPGGFAVAAQTGASHE